MKITTRDGETFNVTSIRKVTQNNGDKIVAVFGTNEDGTEHGPYYEDDFITA